MPSRPSRRQFLAGLVVLSAAGCRRAGSAQPAPTASPTPTVDPDIALVATALSRTERLINAYGDALAGSTDAAVTARLSGLLSEHVRHRSALLEWWPADAPYPPAPEGENATAVPTATEPTATPAPADGSLDRLQAMETAASKQRADLALTASALLARLLASISASNAAHAALLDQA